MNEHWDNLILPDPPQGFTSWRQVTEQEYLLEFMDDRPTAYVEWCASREVYEIAYFVANKDA